MSATIDRNPAYTRGLTARALDAYREMPAATDEEAELPRAPVLRPTAGEQEQIGVYARAYAKAAEAAREREQNLAAATRVAQAITQLQQQAGVCAASMLASPGDKVKARMLKELDERINDARNAERALPALKDELSDLRAAVASARSRLHEATSAVIKQVVLRASAYYATLAGEVTRCAAAIDAALIVMPEAQSSGLATAWHGHFVHDLSLPTPPNGLRAEGCSRHSATMNFRESLLKPEHPRYTLNCTAALGWLQADLTAALAPSGLAPAALLK
jgi:hypothetical protein